MKKKTFLKFMLSQKTQKVLLVVSCFSCLVAPLLRQTVQLQRLFEAQQLNSNNNDSSSTSPVENNGECPNKRLWRSDNEHGRRLSQLIDSNQQNSSSLVIQDGGSSSSSSSGISSAIRQRKAASSSKNVRREVLVVVPGLGDPNRIDTTLRSLDTISSTLKRDQHGFSCLVYVYKAEVLAEAERRLGHLCIVVYNEGLWTHHMKRVPAPLPESTTHVAVLMDDIDVTEIDVPDFLNVMDWTEFGVASPAVKDYPCMDGRCSCLYHRTDFVNILFTVFTKPVWECWHYHIDEVNNPFGWGLDLLVSRLCNTSAGIVDVYEAYHRSTGSLYNRDNAHHQMLEFIYNKTGTDDPQRAYECAVLHRPQAFEECLLYWDGSEATKNNVDWDCFRNKTVDETSIII